MKYIIFLFFGLLLCNSGTAEAATLFGNVSDDHTSLGIKGVQLILQPGNFKTFSDEQGAFYFRNLSAGTYKLTITHPRYKTYFSPNIILETDQQRELLIRLKAGKRSSGDVLFNNTKNATRSRGINKPTRIVKKQNSSGKAPPAIRKMEAMELRKPDTPAHTSGLRAGFADDNQQFNYFINFLKKFEQTPHFPLYISERIRLNVLDRDGRSVPNAQIEIREKNKLLSRGLTFADGSFYIFPQDIKLKGGQIRVHIQKDKQAKSIVLERSGIREVSVQLQEARNTSTSIPLDLLFVLDATGSMGEEIARLKNTIEIINLNLSSLNIKPALRFGLVAYRDREDDYVTRLIPFTKDLDLFRRQLQKIKADGGGDTPEDLQSALDDALHKMDWNPDGLRLAFIITDAGLHLDYGQEFTYADAARQAKQKAIKIFSVGTGGLDISGEYVLRQIAQYCSGKYIFLTYGEKGESEGGIQGSVSHHTGSNFNTGNLETIIIRFAKEELAHLSPVKIEESSSWFEASKIADEDKQQTLQILYRKAVQELIDFSTISVKTHTTLAALPFQVAFDSQSANAEYFYEQLMLSLSKNSNFKLIERKDLQFICNEIGLQLSGLTDENNAAKVGGFIGAEMLISGQFYFNNNKYELFLKLIRVETAEILAVTRIRLDPFLGL